MRLFALLGTAVVCLLFVPSASAHDEIDEFAGGCGGYTDVGPVVSIGTGCFSCNHTVHYYDEFGNEHEHCYFGEKEARSVCLWVILAVNWLCV